MTTLQGLTVLGGLTAIVLVAVLFTFLASSPNVDSNELAIGVAFFMAALTTIGTYGGYLFGKEAGKKETKKEKE